MDVAATKNKGVLSEIVENMTFASYLSLLTRATAESDEPTPGHMLKEIELITFQSTTHCQQLLEYLNRRLAKPSTNVKQKVLKIMFHLVQNGHPAFRYSLRNNDEAIKLATMYHGPPDPFLGTTAYEHVRKLSQELLDILFNPEQIQHDESKANVLLEERVKLHLGGLGSSGNTHGKYEGFGCSPINKEETMKDKVVDVFDKLINPTDNTADIIQAALASSPGSYEAVHLEPQMIQCDTLSPVNKSCLSTKPKVHIPGKAGGGWDSDDEQKEKTFSINPSNDVSMDSLDNIEGTALLEDMPIEKQIVMEFCKNPNMPNSILNVNKIGKMCSSLNYIDVIYAVANFLDPKSMSNSSTSSSVAVLRALLLIEWFLRTDNINPSTISQIISPYLNQIATPETKIEVGVKVKAKKII